MCPSCLVALCLGDEDSREDETFPEADEANEEGAERPQVFGNYKLLGQIGSGGNAIVYKAIQSGTNRVVALKMLDPVRLISAQHRSRFMQEVQTIAALNHTHILPIYEFGTVRGQPYFTAPLIDGGSLAKCFRSILGLDLPVTISAQRRCADLLATIAEAVHFAHQRGVLHRDLTPANILLSRDGIAYVADFGLSKRTAVDADLTCSGAVLGTPGYLSPEQAQGSRSQVTTSSDVYGLGAVLYWMLTGVAPFQSDSPLNVLQLVSESAPEPPSSSCLSLSVDLETICLKCLAKNPGDRYSSTAALAEDLRAFARGNPISARPLSAWTRGVRWCQQRPAIAGLLSVLVLVILLGTGAATWQARRALRAALSEAAALRTAEDQSNLLRQQLVSLQLREAAFEARERLTHQALARLAFVHRADPSNEVVATWIAELLKGGTFRPVSQEVPITGKIVASFLSSETQSALFYSADGILRAFSVDEHPKPRWMKQLAAGAVLSISKNGRWLSVQGERLSIIDVKNGEEGHLEPLPTSVVASAFSPDSTQLGVALEDGRMIIWDLSTRQPREQISAAPSSITALDWGSDDLIGIGCSDGYVLILQPSTASILCKSRWHVGSVGTLSVCSDGSKFAFSGEDRRVLLGRTLDGRIINEASRERADVTHLEFSRTGEHLFIQREGQHSQVWSLIRDRKFFIPTRSVARQAGFHQRGNLIVFSGLDGDLRANVPATGGIAIPHARQTGRILSVSANESDPWILAVSGETFRIWQIEDPHQEIPEIETKTLLRDARLCGEDSVATLERSGEVILWALPSFHEPQKQILPPITLTSECAGMEASACGRWLVTWNKAQASIWSVETRQLAHTNDVGGNIQAAVFDPTGSFLAIRDETGFQILNSGTGTKVGRLLLPAGTESKFQISPGGKFLCFGGPRGEFQVWAVEGSRLVAEGRLGNGHIVTTEFSQDGRFLLAASDSGIFQVWSVEGWQPVSEPRTNSFVTAGASFDGKQQQYVISGTADGTVRIWNWRRGDKVEVFTHGSLNHIREQVKAGYLGEKEDWLVTWGTDRLVRFWDPDTNLPLRPDVVHYGRAFPPLVSRRTGVVITAETSRRLLVRRIVRRTGPAPHWLADYLEDFTGLTFMPDASFAWAPPKTSAELARTYPISALASFRMAGFEKENLNGN